MNLVIVESPTKSKTIKNFLGKDPTKSKTIKNFLGKDYKVLSSFGHIRDLPISELGVDIENNFKPKYIVPLKSRKVLKELKQGVKDAEMIILATDEDREGEAIAWHLSQALKLENPQRIVFHEITKSAIKQAIESPREINMALVDAQQTRRILDRIVGYKISPWLGKEKKKLKTSSQPNIGALKLYLKKKRINLMLY
jgi:DNA topoisomerase-1